MNLTFLHLTLVHIPILLVPLGLCFFLWAIRKQNQTLKGVGLTLFIASAIFVVPAFLVGEDAEDSVKPIAGVDKHDIHEHEEAADFALWFTVALGALSASHLGLDKYKPEKSKTLNIPLIVLALLCSVVLTRTAWLGGKIRHPEAHQSQNSS